MKSSASLMAMLAIAAGTLLGAASGCELIAGVDRNKISETGGAGGEGGTTATGGGGTGGTATTSTSTTSGPDCVDPAADCGAPSGECKVFSCVDGECVEGNVADNMPAATQTAMDCKKNVCVGGAVEAQNDDTDPLDDGNDCTIDVCDMGDPKSNPAEIGFECMAMTKVCDGDGACVECNVDADCKDAAKPDCIDNACVPETCTDGMTNAGETDQDCGGPCKGCDTDQSCTVDGDCFHGICGGGGVCTAPACDDGVQNGADYMTGDGGETDIDCGGVCGPTCGPMKTCDVDGDCVGAQCSGMGGSCVPNCLDKVKNNAETDADCGGGTCGGCAVGKQCEGADANCVGTAYCDVTVCAAKKAPGIVCMGTNQCAAGVCDMTDGVCCNTMCSGTCKSCKLAASAGTCTDIGAGQDPESECAGTQVCDGFNQCKKPDGDGCSTGTECLSGNCADGVCCNTVCGGTCKSCDLPGFVGQCADIVSGQDPDDECAGALSCSGNGACLTADGQSCVVNSQCNSGSCVDTVCCNTACNGVCVSCNLPSLAGTCSPYTAGDDPEGQCSGGTPACNGAGACGKAANGTACTDNSGCTSNNCIDGFCCNNNCNGLCEACSAALTGGTNGTCSGVTVGTDPQNECSGGTPNCAAANMCGP